MFMDLKSRAAMHDFHVHMITTDDHRRMKGVITAAFGADTRMATTAAAAAATDAGAPCTAQCEDPAHMLSRIFRAAKLGGAATGAFRCQCVHRHGGGGGGGGHHRIAEVDRGAQFKLFKAQITGIFNPKDALGRSFQRDITMTEWKKAFAVMMGYLAQGDSFMNDQVLNALLAQQPQIAAGAFILPTTLPPWVRDRHGNVSTPVFISSLTCSEHLCSQLGQMRGA